MFRKVYARYGKRALDLGVAGSALALGWPLLAAVAVAVRWRLGSPVVFEQPRPGLHGRIFTIYKFRTMTDARDQHGRLLPDAERLTPFGRFLRSSSLDELPELWNVVRGEMSLVGPRPLLVHYLEHYTPEQARRHEVRPGITGWAQVHGRNDTSWSDRLARDVWYVDNVSLRLDLRILLETLWITASRRGINKAGHSTMPAFASPPESQGMS